MADKKDNGMQYKIVVPAPIAWPIFHQAELDKAKARGVKADQWGGKIGFEANDTRIAEIKNLMAAEAKKAFPGVPMASLRFPLQSGAKMQEKGKNQWAGDKVWLTVKKPLAKQDGTKLEAPTVFHRVDGHVVVLKEAGDLLYSGVLVAAELTFKATKGNGSTIKDGVTCYVNTIFTTGRGERIGGRSGDDIYADVEGKVTDENPLDPDEMVV